jgi:signal transduction histidine kinase
MSRPVDSAVASVRIVRVMALALGVGGLVFCALAAPSLVQQYSRFSPVWTWTIALALVICLVLMTALSWVVSPLGLTTLAVLVAIVYLAGLVTVPLAVTAPVADIRIWLVGLSTIAAAAAAVAWRPWVAWVYLLTALVITFADQVLVSRGGSPDFAAQETIFDLFFGAVFVALALATRRAGRILDVAAERAIAEVRTYATTSARSREQARIDALVHDSVLVALLASASGRAGSSAASRQARTALTQIEAFGSDHSERHLRPGIECVWEVQAITTEIAPAATFSYRVDGELSVPGDVVLALSEATAEALRNSVAHANGPRGMASRAVHVSVDASGIEVTMLDDGTGFDPAAVPPTRLGIAVSIVGRMAGVVGGHAIVVSRPGTGTRVSLRWRAL